MSESANCIPFVAAIIERQTESGIEVLVQTRWNTKYPSKYNGTIEFAAGVLDVAYENVYDAVSREVKEETGCTVKRFIDSDRTEAVSPQGTDKVFGFRPFCCTQQLVEGRPWVGFIFRVEVYPEEPKDQIGESKDVRWVNIQEILAIYKSDPGKLFTLEVPAWEYYFKELELL